MGHIRETADDKMDWKFYYSYGIPKDATDEQWRDEIGHRGWAIIHGAIENYPCSICSEPGKRLFRGIHDVKNIQLGKPVRYPDDVKFLYDETAGAMLKVQQLNRHLVQHAHRLQEPMHVRVIA